MGLFVGSFTSISGIFNHKIIVATTIIIETIQKENKRLCAVNWDITKNDKNVFANGFKYVKRVRKCE